MTTRSGEWRQDQLDLFADGASHSQSVDAPRAITEQRDGTTNVIYLSFASTPPQNRKGNRAGETAIEKAYRRLAAYADSLLEG